MATKEEKEAAFFRAKAEAEKKAEDQKLAAMDEEPAPPPPISSGSIEASMGLVRRVQLLLFAVLLPLREAISGWLLLRTALGERAWADALLLGGCLVAGGVCNGLAAAGALLPDVPGLDLSAGDSCNEEEGSEGLREQQRQHQREPPALRLGVYLIELPRRVVLALGAAGLAMPMQAVHDAWQGVETINLVELRRLSALLCSVPMLYAKAAVIGSNGGPSMALAVQPLLIESALLSAAGATVGLVALWTSPTVAPDRRVHGRVLRRCVVVVSCAAFCLSDLVLRAMAVGVVAHSGATIATVPSALLLLLLCWGSFACVDRIAAGAHARPHLGFARTAALQLLGPHAGALVTPSFLVLDACASTLLCLLIILGQLLPPIVWFAAEGLLGQRSADLPPPTALELLTAANAIGVAATLAVYKLTLLAVSVWPLRVGGLAMGMRPTPQAIDERDGRTALHHAAACGSLWFTWYYLRYNALHHAPGATAASSMLDHADRYGRTALLLACTAGHEQPARLLLARGAQLEHRDAFGWTPLLCACAKGREPLVSLLLHRGAALHHRDNNDATPLLLASANGHEGTARRLPSPAPRSVRDRGMRSACPR